MLGLVRGRGRIMLGYTPSFSEEKSKILSEGEGEFPKITFLYRWCHGHYREGGSPMLVFLDLIGYPIVNTHDAYFDPHEPPMEYKSGLGALELDYLGEALMEYNEKGKGARLYLDKLITQQEESND